MSGRRAVLAWALCAGLLLSGCSSMLNRDYTSVTVHSAAPAVEGDQLAIRVESYQDLVNALLYFVTQRETQGVVRLYNYPYDVEKDLDAACREVTREDPLGAYAVRDIGFDVAPIVSCYEADFRLSYRRTKAEIDAVATATGASAIRTVLRDFLSRFQEESAIRLSYFDGDEEEIRTLLRQAYYGAPEAALDMPAPQISFYPESGRQRIVELRLRYSLSQEELERRRRELERLSGNLAAELWGAEEDEGLEQIARAVLKGTRYDPKGGETAWHALAEGRADSLGLALCMSLLCKQLDYSCQIVQGTLDGEARFWNIVSSQSGYRHVDLTARAEGEEEPFFRSDRYMAEHGYQWDNSAVPLCGEQPGAAPAEQEAQ